MEGIGIAAWVTVKAFCLTSAYEHCGFVKEIWIDGKSEGMGIITYQEIAAELSSETKLTAYVIPREDFDRVWRSTEVFEWDIEVVRPNSPQDPVVCRPGNYEFVTRYSLGS